jgi:hypothetical protein
LATLNVLSFTEAQTINELGSVSINDLPGVIDSFIGQSSGVVVVAFKETTLWQLSSVGSNETPWVVESQDFDLDRPDDTKTFLMFGARVKCTGAVKFALQASTNYGVTWRSLGNLDFSSTDSEDSINFRLTGSTVRFRLTSLGSEDVATLLEITMRVKVRTDREFQRS